jgi:hypothetical protein
VEDKVDRRHALPDLADALDVLGESFGLIFRFGFGIS